MDHLHATRVCMYMFSIWICAKVGGCLLLGNLHYIFQSRHSDGRIWHTTDRPTDRLMMVRCIILCVCSLFYDLCVSMPLRSRSALYEWCEKYLKYHQFINAIRPAATASRIKLGAHFLSYILYIRTKCGIRQRALSSTKKFNRRTIIARSGCAPESVELVWYLICANLMCEIL